MIDLNNDEFDGGNNVAIFNGGTAGIVDNVTLTIEKKKADAKEGSPDYKLIFTDASGATCNNALWFVTKPTEHADLDKLTNKQGKILKHVAHAVLGDDFSFPQFGDATAMLNGIMKLVKEGLPTAGTFRIFANYGATISPKAYIQPRSWVPFMEPMTVAEDSSRLKVGDIDNMIRLQEDKFVNNGAVTPGATVGADDDWND